MDEELAGIIGLIKKGVATLDSCDLALERLRQRIGSAAAPVMTLAKPGAFRGRPAGGSEVGYPGDDR